MKEFQGIHYEEYIPFSYTNVFGINNATSAKSPFLISNFNVIFAPYDTGTIKRFERPYAGFEEVSLTSRTVNRK